MNGFSLHIEPPSYLNDNYITNFDFVKYAFVNLVVAWL